MKKPNIVWVLTDDQGTGDLGCTGNPVVQTPNIDKFYEQTSHFNNFHVGPTCAPSRSTLMTGHYANSTGVWHTVGGRSLLREDEWSLANALKSGGYTTGIFGKWHLGDSYPYRACDRGFDYTVNHGGGGISQLPDFWGNDYFDDTYMVNGVPKKFNGYCTDVFFEESIKFIDEHKDEPFFCYITTNAPHGPFNVPKKYYDIYKDDERIDNDNRKRFYGMITNIDENFGKLVEHLEEIGIADNTIIIFMTDNGTSTGITVKDNKVVNGYNAGLRGGKNSEYDGGHRVPFFVRYDALNINSKREIDNLTASVDVMPTLLEMCGVNVGEHTFHGKSLLPLLKGEKVADRVVVTDSQRVPDPIKWRKSATMNEQYRLVNGEELYDINNDREQQNNIAEQHPEIVEQLRQEYEKWWDLVSVKFNEEIPIHFCSKELSLTTHDMRNNASKSVYSQGQVRAGMQDKGYYEVKVDESGRYNIELRRWSRDFPRKICDGIDPNNNDVQFQKDCIAQKDIVAYSGGVALNIKKATIEIGTIKLEKEVKKDDEFISFDVDLEAQNTHFSAYFTDDKGEIFATYFIYVNKK